MTPFQYFLVGLLFVTVGAPILTALTIAIIREIKK